MSQPHSPSHFLKCWGFFVSTYEALIVRFVLLTADFNLTSLSELNVNTGQLQQIS